MRKSFRRVSFFDLPSHVSDSANAAHASDATTLRKRWSASSAMGVLIPPCIIMVVLGALMNVSVAALFVAGFLPALVLALGLFGLIAYQARRYRFPSALLAEPLGEGGGTLAGTLGLHEVDVDVEGDESVVSLGQPSRGVIPLLLDGRGRRHQVAGTPEY